jgi:hypothetical protein
VHDAPARAYPALAPTWLEPAHRPFAAAVQSDRATAVPWPPGNAARAAPVVCVRQPVPSQLAVASASASPAEPPVATVQPPAAAQVALAVARTWAPPVAVVLDVARVPQPPALPSSHATAIMAFVVAAVAEVEVVVETLI